MTVVNVIECMKKQRRSQSHTIILYDLFEKWIPLVKIMKFTMEKNRNKYEWKCEFFFNETFKKTQSPCLHAFAKGKMIIFHYCKVNSF